MTIRGEAAGEARSRSRFRGRFRDLPLFWKLLIPFFALMLLVGAAGAFVIVRDLASRVQASLDQELARRSLDATSYVRDRELYLLESVNLAANLQGMPEAIAAHDPAAVARLVRSVRALKTDLDLVAVTDRAGTALAEISGSGATSGGAWSGNRLIDRSIAGDGKASGIVDVGGVPMFGVAAPVCEATAGCKPVGASIVAIRVSALAKAFVESSPERGGSVGAAIYAPDGTMLASAGSVGLPARAPSLPGGRPVRAGHTAGDSDVVALFAPLEIRGEPAGSIAVAAPAASAFAQTRATGLRLAVILLAAMAAIVALGAGLSRFILAQVRPLVATNRALGRGDLSARAPVMGADELGELAVGVNQMAGQLQASHETLELRVKQRTEEVHRLLQERTDFFASISHEFRTPLSVIIGNVELLMDQSAGRTGRWRKDVEETIKESGEHLLRLVNDILALAQAEGGTIELDLEVLQLGGIAERLRGTIEGLARGSELDVTIDLPRDLPAVRADGVRLTEIILNLVDNAVKYTPSGGRVGLRATSRDGLVAVSVADTGPGIPPSAGDRIFEPFYRVAGTQAQRGAASMGLGLALTKRLVEAHGGTIGFESPPGKGTTFTFTIPSVESVELPAKKMPKQRAARPRVVRAEAVR